jgi:hypothetical protein
MFACQSKRGDEMIRLRSTEHPMNRTFDAKLQAASCIGKYICGPFSAGGLSGSTRNCSLENGENGTAGRTTIRSHTTQVRVIGRGGTLITRS